MKTKFEMFQERQGYVEKARELFVKTGKTKNITEALEWYLATLPKKKRIPLFIKTKDSTGLRGHIPSIVDAMVEKGEISRPICPDCGAPMGFKLLSKNDEGYQVRIQCTECDVAFDDKRSMHEVLNALRKEKR